MSNKSLAPRQNLELAKHSEDLAKRGLEIIEEIKQVDVALSESDILPFMERFRKIKNSIGEIPKEFLNRSTANPNDITAFRINDFLLAFDKIRIRKNFILDYVYNSDGHYGGEPLVYAREKSSKPIKSPDEYYERFSIPRPEMLLGDEPNSKDGTPYLPHLEFENSPTGYFEFAIFCMTVRRFYLYWHSNYNSRKYILTKSGLTHFIKNKIGGISLNEIETLKSVETAPKLKIAKKIGEGFDINI
jgi:hypothetical protein